MKIRLTIDIEVKDKDVKNIKLTTSPSLPNEVVAGLIDATSQILKEKDKEEMVTSDASD